MIESKSQAAFKDPARTVSPGGKEPTRASPASPRTLARLGWGVALGLGFLEAWTGRHHIDSDGVSYLDLADAFQRGDWHTAINAYWSPLYPALIALVEKAFPTTPRQEFVVLQILHAAIFVAALSAFAFFLRQVIGHRRARLAADRPARSGVPEPLLIVAAYALAIWAMVTLVTVSVTTPDLLSQTFLLVAAGLLMRMRTRPTGWPAYAMLGTALGLGYLAKAAIFPIAFLFLGAAVIWTADRRWPVGRGLVALAAFAVVSAPLITMLSRSQGRLTFGESGRLNYAWYVLGNGFQRHWQGGSAESGFAEHPTRQLMASPPVFEFDGPIRGTYPVWLDPAYWNQGVRIAFSPGKQLIAVAKHIREYAATFAGLSGVFAVLLVTAYAGGRLGDYAREVAQYGGVIVPSLGAFAMYALVHVEPRFLGAYVIVIGVALLASIRLPNAAWSGRLYGALTIVLVVSSLLPAAWAVGYSVARDVMRPDEVREEKYVAEGLTRLGLQPGEKVGTIGFGATSWARLARVRLIIEVPWGEGPSFWSADPQTAERVLTLFRSAGAKLALAQDVPEHRSGGWTRIERTNYFYRVLR